MNSEWLITLNSSFMEWLKIGLSGFIMTVVSSIITWYLTKKHYKKQIADQIYIGAVLQDLYNPIVNEYKRVIMETTLGNNVVLNVNLILSTIQNNTLILNTLPRKIKNRIELIERLCIACNSPNNFNLKAKRIISELKKLIDDLSGIYKEFSNEKK